MRTVRYRSLSLALCLISAAACGEDENSLDTQDDAATPDHPDAGGKADAGGGKADASAVNDDVDGGVGDDAATDAPASDAGDLPEAADKRAFFLPMPEPDNTAEPTVEVDAQGNVHTVFPAYAVGNAYYTFCAAPCASGDTVQTVRFDSTATVSDAMIVLSKSGAPRILLSSYNAIYYATCEANCGQKSSWTVGKIYDLDGDHGVSGEALALDPQGNPRFIYSVDKAWGGIGQRPPEVRYFSCDTSCTDASNWQNSVIADEIWRETTLRIDATGKPHALTTIHMLDDATQTSHERVAYLECASDCGSKDSWHGIGFFDAYENETELVSIRPATAMELNPHGAPRIAMLSKPEGSTRRVLYFSCEHDCTADNWDAAVVVSGDELAAGIDLSLTADDKPRVAFNHNYNIALGTCDSASCTGTDASWQLQVVEAGGAIPADDIFLWYNCNIGAWFLTDPSLALDSSGLAYVAYQARDVSGGWSTPQPGKPSCTAGLDMAWSRLAILPESK